MAVMDPASPSIRVGAKALSADASELHASAASAASAAITWIVARPGIRLVSAAARTTDHHCPRTPNWYMRSEKVECPGWSCHTR